MLFTSALRRATLTNALLASVLSTPLLLGLSACGGKDIETHEDLSAVFTSQSGHYISLKDGVLLILQLEHTKDGAGNIAISNMVDVGESSIRSGTYTESAGKYEASFKLHYRFSGPNSDSDGSLASEDSLSSEFQLAEKDGVITVTGDSIVAGEYISSAQFFDTVLQSREEQAQCFYEAADIAISTSQMRIPGFGGKGMTQYLGNSYPYSGRVAGVLNVRLDNLLSPKSTFSFVDQQEFPELTLGGTQTSQTGISGSGWQFGAFTATFEWNLTGADAAASKTLAGTISFGTGEEEGIRIESGQRTAGDIRITFDGASEEIRFPITQASLSHLETICAKAN